MTQPADFIAHMTRRELEKRPELAAKVQLCTQLLADWSAYYGVPASFYGLMPGRGAHTLGQSGRILLGAELLDALPESTLRQAWSTAWVGGEVAEHLARLAGLQCRAVQAYWLAASWLGAQAVIAVWTDLSLHAGCYRPRGAGISAD